MRKLSTKPNVVAPDSNYPNGRIKDNPGDGTGTPVSEQVYGDFHQFFDQLMNDVGMTPNGLPEGAYYSYQLNSALKQLIANYVNGEANQRALADQAEALIRATNDNAINALITAKSYTAITLINSWASNGSTAVGYRTDPSGRVWLRGMLSSFTPSTSSTVTNAGAVPNPANGSIYLSIANGSGSTPGVLSITPTGQLIVSGGYAINQIYGLEGVSYQS